MQRTGIALAVVAALAARADADRAADRSPARDPAIRSLGAALPRGWSMTVRAGELVLKRDQQVRIAGHYQENAPSQSNIYVAAGFSAPEIELALRYRIEPRWTERQIADARDANAKVYAELASLRARFQIDVIPTSKGRPLPSNPDEQQRLADFERAQAQAIAKLVALPRCTLGAFSLFDSRETYDQLSLVVDPPIAMRQAFAVVALVKRRCGE
ncbi:MAG TPA: hypothetical protein VFQ53_28335 [Kofleriaceae bacterium]|nr:hypothetical protein [Kofleriaceae bacterium]